MANTPCSSSDTKPIVVLHAASLRWTRPNGITSCLTELLAAQNARQDIHTALLLTSDTQHIPAELGFPVFHWRSLRRSRHLDLPAPFDRPHLVVVHSTYIPAHAVIARRLRRAGIPYIICPHGGMTAGAQSYYRWKKRLGNLLFFDRLVANAAAIQHLTSGEATLSQGWNRPVFVVSNGIHLPPEPNPARPRRTPGLRLVFLGRLAIEHKGLDLLLDACDLVRSLLCERKARVELYGPDQNGSVRQLTQRIAELDLTNLVTLNDSVYGEAKASLFQQTDVFLHTSRWEGQPIAILEALSYGVPCLLTPNTNMAEEVTAADAGWAVAPSPAGIAEGLRRILTADRQTFQTFGANARQLIVQNYTWEQIANRTVEAYRRYAA